MRKELDQQELSIVKRNELDIAKSIKVIQEEFRCIEDLRQQNREIKGRI